MINKRGIFLLRNLYRHITSYKHMKNQQDLFPYPQNYQSLKKLSLFQAYCLCLQNNFNPVTNPKGYVNFGMSINNLAPKISIKYLPQYIKIDDFAYPNCYGLDQQLNKMMAQNTVFSWEQSIVFNCLNAILSTIWKRYGKVCFTGKIQQIDKQQLEVIVDHSNADIISQCEKCNVVILWYPKQEDIQEIRQKFKKKLIMYVIKDKKQLQILFQKAQNNEIFAYEHIIANQTQKHKKISLGIAHTKNKQAFQHLSNGWNYFPTNNLLKRVCLDPNLLKETAQTNKNTTISQAKNDDNLSIIRKTIEKLSNILINKQYLFVTIGATSGLNHLSRALFMNIKNQKLILYTDSPYYTGFDYDFQDGGVRIKSKSMWNQRRAIQRIKQAFQQQNVVGYVICNPNNPVGTVLPPEQVKQICQWAITKPNFHLIFDEMYINLCVSKQSTMSSLKYSLEYPNIHTVRGFAKDLGTCGFNIGITISSNSQIREKFNKWNKIMGHQDQTISIINQMLLKSNYGQQIFKEVRSKLHQCFNKIFQILDRQNIKYIKPQGGCFIFVDLRQHLKQNTVQQQNRLWKKLFYKYRLNVSSGSSYHSVYPGFYRVSPVAQEEIMIEGLKRLAAAIQDKQ